MSPEALALIKNAAGVLAAVIGVIDCAGILIIIIERFGHAKGRIIFLIGWLLPGGQKNPMKRSLLLLRKWHDPKEREALMRGYGREQHLMDKHPFSQWMVAEMVHNYENNVQGIAYLGAAVLIFVIGLRGIQILTKDDSEFIILALLLEFTLIGILGIMLFYKPEDDPHGSVDLTVLAEIEKLKTDLIEKDTALRTLRSDVDTVIKQLEGNLSTLRHAGTGPRPKGSA